MSVLTRKAREGLLWSPNCVCGCPMRLVTVEPADQAGVDVRSYECEACQQGVFDLRPIWNVSPSLSTGAAVTFFRDGLYKPQAHRSP